MASAGTLLTDLDDKPAAAGGGDEDLVQKIMAEMNTPSGGNVISPQPVPAPGNREMMAATLPSPGSVSQLAMDPQTATAHMIGGQHPTPADFAHAMYAGAPPPMMGAIPQNPYMMAAPPAGFAPQPQYQTGGLMSAITVSVFREMKTPLLVALIIFVISLPFVNTMIGMYMPSLLRMGGDLTTFGLVLKSLVGGTFFWVLHRIVAPLI